MAAGDPCAVAILGASVADPRPAWDHAVRAALSCPADITRTA
jgi:hypothetical protein